MENVTPGNTSYEQLGRQELYAIENHLTRKVVTIGEGLICLLYCKCFCRSIPIPEPISFYSVDIDLPGITNPIHLSLVLDKDNPLLIDSMIIKLCEYEIVLTSINIGVKIKYHAAFHYQDTHMKITSAYEFSFIESILDLAISRLPIFRINILSTFN